MNIESNREVQNAAPTVAPLNPSDWSPKTSTPTPFPFAGSIPARVGKYRILRLLGEGGMGVVYEAEQENPRRVVALKVIKPGPRGSELVRRFEQESMALGRLQHPGIAHIYEAGTADTPFGPQHFLAIEFIHGESLQEYVRKQALNVRQRLELAITICDAVHYAHQRGVIHRDLKPGNILVDESGLPKILDFGVARATDSDTHVTRHTDLGQLVGTLAYMSPEQALGDPLELDIRSDVYSLGVMLYELLAGRLPYCVSQKLHQALHTIREEDPVSLSSISRFYRGDVETIVAKALEKDKRRRYSSADNLAADIRRYLQDEPIAARPASTTYQLRKFARRHKALMGSIASIFAVLIAGVIVSAREAARANEESATSHAISDFLQKDLLAQASINNQAGPSNTKPDPDLKVRTALDRAASRITGRFDRQPKLEAAIRDTIGQTYLDLGLYAEGRRQLQRALDLRVRVLGRRNPETLKTMSRVGYAAYLQGKYPEAEAILDQSLQMQRVALGPGDLDTLTSMSYLATVYWAHGKYAQAESLHAQTLESRRRLLGPEHPDTLASMTNLAIVYKEEAKYAQAESLDMELLEVRRRIFGSEHPDTLKSMNNLAAVYLDEGKYAAAEALFGQTLEIRRRLLGPEHPTTLMTMHNVAIANLLDARYSQAEVLLRQTLAMQRRVLGPEYPDTLMCGNNLANVYLAEGKYAKAEAIFSRTVDIQRRVLGPEHRYTLDSITNVAIAEAAQGKYLQAERLFSRSIEDLRRVLGTGHPDYLSTLSETASMYQREGKYALAEKYAGLCLAGRRQALGSAHADTIGAAQDLSLAYLSQLKFADAEPLAHEVLELTRRKQPDDWRRFRAESLLGAILFGEQRYAESKPLLLDGYQGMLARKDRMSVQDWYHLDLASKWLQSHQASGKRSKAADRLAESRRP